MEEQIVKTIFKRIDEIKERLTELEKETKTAKELALYASKSQAGLIGLLKEHQAKVKGLIDAWKIQSDSMIKQIREEVERNFLEYQKELSTLREVQTSEFKSMLNKNSNKLIMWFIGSGIFLLILAKLLRL